MLATYLSDQKLGINDIAENQFMTQDDALWAIRAIGLDPDTIEIKTWQKLRSAVGAWIIRLYNEQDVFPGLKVHAANAWMEGPENPYINWPYVHSVVYLVRDPRDLARSFYTHMGRSDYESVVEDLNSKSFSTCKEGTGIVTHMGSWSQHVTHWTEGHPWADRVLAVKYEDLVRDTHGWFKHILKKFDIEPIEDDRVARTVEFCALDELKRQEAETPFTERPDTTDNPFFGHKHPPLPDWAREQIENDHREVMERYGYL